MEDALAERKDAVAELSTDSPAGHARRLGLQSALKAMDREAQVDQYQSQNLLRTVDLLPGLARVQYTTGSLSSSSLLAIDRKI